jgi:hypothetical protein
VNDGVTQAGMRETLLGKRVGIDDPIHGPIADRVRAHGDAGFL